MKITLYLLIIVMASTFINAQESAKVSSNLNSETEEVYIIGKVHTPTKISLVKPLKLMNAVRQAGGTILAEKKSRAVISRRLPDCEFITEISVDLRDILAKRFEDIPLQASDVVEILERKSKNNRASISQRPCVTAEKPNIVYRFPSS